MIDKVRHHVCRLWHAFGRPLKLGQRSYRLRGYHPDNLARDYSDEPHMLPVWERILNARDGAVIDVGASCGQTLIKVLTVDPQRPYFGFEPQIECCFYIEHFLRSNSIKTASIVPVALANTNGLVELFWDMPGDLTASLLPSHAYSPNEKRPHSSWTVARRGDELVRELEINSIAAIKIDVEGFELEVLSGLSETIAKIQPVILLEVLPNFAWGEPLKDHDTCRVKQDRANRIFTLLTGLGYLIYRVDGFGSEHRIESFDLGERPALPFVNDARDYVARHFHS